MVILLHVRLLRAHLGKVQLKLTLRLDGVDEESQPLEVDVPLALALLEVLKVGDLEFYVPGLWEPAEYLGYLRASTCGRSDLDVALFPFSFGVSSKLRFDYDFPQWRRSQPFVKMGESIPRDSWKREIW
jgi:hypothetical protein